MVQRNRTANMGDASSNVHALTNFIRSALSGLLLTIGRIVRIALPESLGTLPMHRGSNESVYTISATKRF
jgi:hypothetical protein